jgi:hypothetical protein
MNLEMGNANLIGRTSDPIRLYFEIEPTDPCGLSVGLDVPSQRRSDGDLIEHTSDPTRSELEIERIRPSAPGVGLRVPRLLAWCPVR